MPESPTCARPHQVEIIECGHLNDQRNPSSSAVVTPIQGSIYKTGGAASKNTDENNVCITLTPPENCCTGIE